jgi:hypothetical protein
MKLRTDATGYMIIINLEQSQSANAFAVCIQINLRLERVEIRGSVKGNECSYSRRTPNQLNETLKVEGNSDWIMIGV